MKTLFMLALAFMALAFPVAAQDRSVPGPHPYLAFSDRNVARLKANVAADAEARERWRRVQARADAALRGGVEPRRSADALMDLSLSYRMTGDLRYAVAARDLLLTRAAMPSWLTDMPLSRRDPVWNSDLGMGPNAAAFGNAYDAVYDTLTPEERRTLAAGVTRAAIEPILGDWVDGVGRIHSLDSMGHNWWSHIVFGAGVASIAILDEEPRAAQWVARVDEASTEWFRYAGSAIETKPATFGDDGSYSETVNYADFALNGIMAFRRAHNEAFGNPGEPLPTLANTADFFLQTAYPTSQGAISINYGDSRPTSQGAMTMADLWALGDRDPRYLWYIDQFAAEPGETVWDDAINLVYLPDAADRAQARATPTLPTSAMFSGQGWAMLRDSWDDDATLFSIRSGFTWNHNHADAGAFMLEHRGQSLLIDSGVVPYSTPQYDAYYRQSAAHNVVLFDGKAELPADTYSGSHLFGQVDHLVDGGDLRYLWADATGPTAQVFQRNFRSVLWVGDVILVIDDLKTPEPGQFEWLLHYGGEGRRDLQDLVITKGEAEVRVRPLFPQTFPDGGLPTDYPENLRLVVREGLQNGAPTEVRPFFSIQPTTKTDRENFIVAILPVTPGKALPTLERIEALNVRGVRIRQGGKVTDVYYNQLADGRIRHRNANAVLGGFETDAYLFAVTYPEGAAPDAEPSAFFVANGSYVRRAGTVYLDSLSKVFLNAEHDGDGLRVSLDGQPNLNVRLRCAGETAVRVAGWADAAPCVDDVAVLRAREQAAP